MKTGLAFLVLSVVIFAAMSFVFSDRTRMALAPNDTGIVTSFARASLQDAAPAAATGQPRAVAGPLPSSVNEPITLASAKAAPVIVATGPEAAPARPVAAPAAAVPAPTPSVRASVSPAKTTGRPVQVATLEKAPRRSAPAASPEPTPATPAGSTEPAPEAVRRPPPVQGPQL